VNPEQVFDDLHAGGHVQVWDTAADALGQLAWETASSRWGVSQAVSVAANDDAAAVNEVVREQLVTAAAVDDTQVTHGLRIGVGDQVMTRQNKPDLRVANRMTWTVTGIADEGSVQLYNEARRQQATVDPDYRHHLHLAYAATGHGVQGDTAEHGDLVLSDSNDAAAAYVGLTRGARGRVPAGVRGRAPAPAERPPAVAGEPCPGGVGDRVTRHRCLSVSAPIDDSRTQPPPPGACCAGGDATLVGPTAGPAAAHHRTRPGGAMKRHGQVRRHGPPGT
jgi:hypothetical protein